MKELTHGHVITFQTLCVLKRHISANTFKVIAQVFSYFYKYMSVFLKDAALKVSMELSGYPGLRGARVSLFLCFLVQLLTSSSCVGGF